MATIPAAEFLTAPQIAESLGVNPHKVILWIARGELLAIDISQTRAKMPRWRIRREDFDAFLERRTSSPTPKTVRRRRKRNADGVIEFYK